MNAQAPSPDGRSRSTMHGVERAGRATNPIARGPFPLLERNPPPMSRPVHRLLDDSDLADLILLVVCAFTVVGVAYLIAPIVGD